MYRRLKLPIQVGLRNRVSIYQVKSADAGATQSFSDMGPGVPEGLRDRVFEPFFTHGKREGAGLGLSIARRIVEEHGGRLWIEGGEGGGATFVLSLPL